MHVIVAGGGRVGEQVARALSAAGSSAAVVELDAKRAAALAAGGLTVVQGNACVAETLEAAGGLRAGALVACTGADEENLVVSLLARRHLEIPRIVARLNDDANRWLFDATWGVDATVSTAVELVGLVADAIEPPGITHVVDIPEASGSLLEGHVTPGSALAGTTVADLDLGGDGLVAGVVRHGRTIPADAGLRLRAGDRLLVVTGPRGEDALRTALGAGTPAPEPGPPRPFGAPGG